MLLCELSVLCGIVSSLLRVSGQVSDLTHTVFCTILIGRNNIEEPGSFLRSVEAVGLVVP